MPDCLDQIIIAKYHEDYDLYIVLVATILKALSPFIFMFIALSLSRYKCDYFIKHTINVQWGYFLYRA